MKKKTVSEIYREWRIVKHHLVKESSFATYSINIERHILPAFGNCRTVDNDDAQALAFRLAADGLSANTVKGVMLVTYAALAEVTQGQSVIQGDGG